MRIGSLGGLLLMLVMSSIARGAAPAAATRPAVEVVGRIRHAAITECSGLAASRQYPGVFWTHNDGGNTPTLYAINREGRVLAEFPVAATNDDWEDIAIDDEGRLYIGDIGNNNLKRKQLVVYQVKEPDMSSPPKLGEPPRRIEVMNQWRLEFAGEAFDCEALFVYRGMGYVISKIFVGGKATIYSFPLEPTDAPVVMKKVTKIPIRSPVTAADISPDGRRLAVMTVVGLNVFTIDGDVTKAAKATPVHIPYFHPNLEACCFVADGVLAAAETREVLLFRVPEP